MPVSTRTPLSLASTLFSALLLALTACPADPGDTEGDESTGASVGSITSATTGASSTGSPTTSEPGSTGACLNTCKAAKCGDGQVQAGVEECDDGNVNNNDGCSGACKLEINMVCLNPIQLTLNNRNVAFNDGGTTLRCDWDGWNNPGPNDWTTPNAWYRFTGAAGTKMPTSAPPIYSCGTHAPGWMQGAYPTLQEGIVTRTVCYNWSGNTCLWSNPIKVVNCGSYYVFQLPSVAAQCWLRYCGTN